MSTGANADSASVLASLHVMVVVLLVTLPANGGLEAGLAVVVVVNGACVAVRLYQGVGARDRVSFALLVLLLDIAGVRVLDSVRELVVGGRIMVLILVMTGMLVVVLGRGDGNHSQKEHTLEGHSVRTYTDGLRLEGGHVAWSRSNKELMPVSVQTIVFIHANHIDCCRPVVLLSRPFWRRKSLSLAQQQQQYIYS